jgi:hypothetical protein
MGKKTFNPVIFEWFLRLKNLKSQFAISKLKVKAFIKKVIKNIKKHDIIYAL